MTDTTDVTACLVTRGNVDLDPILDTLIFDNVIVWDNSERPDWKCAGRYLAALEADTEWVYWQDDDTIVPAATQQALLVPGLRTGMDIVANWAHGDNHDGYDDLPLVGAGAVARPHAAWDAIARYGARYPIDEDFMYEADFVVGALYRQWRHVFLPFAIRNVAYNGDRLADEPWQRDLKRKITERARGLREVSMAAA